MLTPFLDRLDRARSVLIAGCGGGFDVYAGIPLALHCRAKGQKVALANLSFTDLASSGGDRGSPTLWRIDRRARKLAYFPELWLCEWLSLRGMIDIPVYAFAKTGVGPLTAAYRKILETEGVDLVVLIDGGTDSILFGDEPGLGTVAEDALSLVAANNVFGDAAILACIGFGVDHFHGVSHHSFLENAATLIRSGGFLGALAAPAQSDEVAGFLDLVEYANGRQPNAPSIVNNSIASAYRGEFGDYHATSRTIGSELFINPLMSQYWFFNAPSVVTAMSWAHDLIDTHSFADVEQVIARHREHAARRPLKPIPL